MHEAYLEICGIPTKVITYGKWVEESFAEDEPKDIVVCIPGNPGVTKFYSKFLQTIHQQLGYPVWIVGHAGFELPKDDSYRNVPALADNERLYGLQGQTIHKQTFIETYVPKDARIHFIGHSIGAYMILQLLKIPSIRSQTVVSYFMFPTIEKIADSTNGKLFSKFVSPLVPLILFFAFMFTMLPLLVRSMLLQPLLLMASIPKTHLKTIVGVIEPDTLKKAYSLALDEFTFVNERETDVIVKNKNIIKLYYGANDGWTPLSYYQKMKDDIPGINAEICDRNFDHVFVLKHSVEAGKMVADWIKT